MPTEMNVSYYVDDRHTAKWRFKVLVWIAARLGITLINNDQEFAK
jgi:hypothetical protein